MDKQVKQLNLYPTQQIVEVVFENNNKKYVLLSSLEYRHLLYYHYLQNNDDKKTYNDDDLNNLARTKRGTYQLPVLMSKLNTLISKDYKIIFNVGKSNYNCIVPIFLMPLGVIIDYRLLKEAKKQLDS